MHRRRPSKKEGAGNAGCSPHPPPCVQNKENEREANTGTPKSHGTPCAMVLRLLRDLPGEPAFLPPSPASHLAGLSPALAGQDHTALPYASGRLVLARPRPSEPPL